MAQMASMRLYRKLWSLCKADIVLACDTWLQNGSLPLRINATNIALIPKRDIPESMRDLRPILLCNVVYKILSKALAVGNGDREMHLERAVRLCAGSLYYR